MLLATLIWSGVCVATFLFARAAGARDYQSFFSRAAGPGWIAFEAAYVLFVILILAVFGAAAGAIAASSGWPAIVGTLALMAAIALVVAYRQRLGRAPVHVRLVPALRRLRAVPAAGAYAFRRRYRRRDSRAGYRCTAGSTGGVTYASYNIIGAVVILPVLRHLTSDRDAVVAGLIAGRSPCCRRCCSSAA